MVYTLWYVVALIKVQICQWQRYIKIHIQKLKPTHVSWFLYQFLDSPANLAALKAVRDSDVKQVSGDVYLVTTLELGCTWCFGFASLQ